MAVRAYELALFDLPSGLTRLSCPDQIADLGELLAPGQVIPGHRDRMEEPPAVRTRSCALDLTVPFVESTSSFLHLFLTLCSVPRVIRAVVLLPTDLAIHLTPVSPVPAVELVE